MAYEGRNNVTKEVCIFVKSNLWLSDIELRELVIRRYGLEYAPSTIHRIRMGEYDEKMNLPHGAISSGFKDDEVYDSPIYYKSNNMNLNRVYEGHSSVLNKTGSKEVNNNRKMNHQQKNFYGKKAEKGEKNKEEYIIGGIAAFIGIGGILNGALDNICSIIIAVIFLGVAWKCFFK